MLPEIQTPLANGSALDAFGVVLGGLIVIFGVVCLRKSLTIGSWTPVEGTILRSKVYLGTSFHASILYRYVYQGISRQGSRIRIIPRSYIFKRKAREEASKYTPHQPVTVWVNPRNPKDAVLEPEPQYVMSLLQVALGLFFIWLGLSGILG